MSNYLTFSSPNEFTLGVANNTKTWNGTLEYSTDGSTWNTWSGTSAISSVGGKLYMRGTNNTYITGTAAMIVPFDGVYEGRWVLTGSNIACSGNIDTLLDYTLVANDEQVMVSSNANAYCYVRLFEGCSSLVTAPELPATTLATGCYGFLFKDCTSLTTAPILPATTLETGCYRYMFSNCTSLTKAPELPATTLASYCYLSMFYGCTSLTTVPKLPATTLAVGCYEAMFQGCTSLTTLPELPATTIEENAYAGMFTGCTQIKMSSTSTDEYHTPYTIPSNGRGVHLENSMAIDMFRNTGGTFTSRVPDLNTTLYTSNEVLYLTDDIRVNVLSSGITTLATQGKYCDKDIAVNIGAPVPSGYILPSGQIVIDRMGNHRVDEYQMARVFDEDCIASNIKKDVTIFGVTGSLVEGITPTGTKTITSNGTHDVTNYASATVNVQPNLDYPELSYMENGSYELEPREGYDGLEGARIVVAVPTYITVSSEDDIPTDAVDGTIVIVEASGANLISFTVDGTTYQAEDGMTWEQWVDSEYNTDGFYISLTNIHRTEYYYISNVTQNNTITNGTAYTLVGGGGGGI